MSWPLSEKNVQNSTTQDTDNFSKHTESIGINQTFAKTVSSNVLYSFPQYRISFIYVRVCVRETVKIEKQKLGGTKKGFLGGHFYSLARITVVGTNFSSRTLGQARTQRRGTSDEAPAALRFRNLMAVGSSASKG